MSAQSTLHLTIQKENQAPELVSRIPDQTVYEGLEFQFNLAPFFFDADGDVLEYGVSGLPRGTGIKVATLSGQLAGIPTTADLKQMQPLKLVINVIDGRGGRVAADMFVTVRPGNRPPIALPIPAAYVTVGHRFSFNAAAFFADEDGDPLFYRMEGLSENSGLRFNPRTAEVFGVPTLHDLERVQPMELAIWASDGKEGKARGLMFITVRPANRDPISMEIPDATIAKGNEMALLCCFSS